MGEISKAVGQWMVGNVGWTAIIILFVVSGLFKLTKREVDPLGWILSQFGKAITKEVRKDVADLKKETGIKFAEVKTDRSAKIQELKSDYEEKIGVLSSDLEEFKTSTNNTLTELKKGTADNCNKLQRRLDEMEKSNDMQTMRQIKAHILDFANSCRNGRKHTMEDFKNVLDENREYENLVKKYNLKNDIYTEDLKYIKKIYQHCLETNDFLA